MATRSKKSGAPTPGADKRVAMLDDHVRFECARWQGEQLAVSLHEEIDALYAWLADVRVRDVLPAEESAETLALALGDLELTDDAVALGVEVVYAAHAALLASDAVATDIVEKRDLHGLVDVLSELDDLRGKVIGAVTDHPAYHELVAHVLYNGVKAFVLNENPVARRLPGAQSLIKLGQRGLQNAAPGLESGVDKQLRRFVQNQIGDTLSDSKRFLDSTLSGKSAHDLLDTSLRSLGSMTLSDLAARLSEDDLSALIDGGTPLVQRVVASGVLTELAERFVEQILTTYADRPVAQFLDEIGAGPEPIGRLLTDLAAPALKHATETGFLEQRIRARLAAFYLA